jgi:hypothetical protein
MKKNSNKIEEEEDPEKKHHDLVENFLKHNDLRSFKKMFNDKPTIIKKKNTNTFKSKNSGNIQRKFTYNPHYTENNYDNFYENYNKFQSDKDLENFHLDRYNNFADPEFKDKNMKGNYKWGQMKFERMKMNLAKRYGIDYQNFQIPKAQNTKKTSNVDINGDIIPENQNKLSKSNNNNVKLPKNKK